VRENVNGYPEIVEEEEKEEESKPEGDTVPEVSGARSSSQTSLPFRL